MNVAYVNAATGIVENLIVASPDDPVDEEHILVRYDDLPDIAISLSIGDRWDGGQFILQPRPKASHAPTSTPSAIPGLEML